jgi:hypothetical protein
VFCNNPFRHCFCSSNSCIIRWNWSFGSWKHFGRPTFRYFLLTVPLLLTTTSLPLSGLLSYSCGFSWCSLNSLSYARKDASISPTFIIVWIHSLSILV